MSSAAVVIGTLRVEVLTTPTAEDTLNFLFDFLGLICCVNHLPSRQFT